MKSSSTKKSFKLDPERARRSFQKARDRLTKQGSPLDLLTKEEIIRKVKKTREQIWEEKFAAHS